MMKALENLRTPCYVVDEAKLIKNLELLKAYSRRNRTAPYSAATKNVFLCLNYIPDGQVFSWYYC